MPSPRLVVELSTRTSWGLPLREGVTRVGSGARQDLRIADPSVANAHCEIIVRAGRVFVRDLGTGHDSFLDGVRVVGTQQVEYGQTLRLGTVDVRLEVSCKNQEPLTAVLPLSKPIHPPGLSQESKTTPMGLQPPQLPPGLAKPVKPKRPPSATSGATYASTVTSRLLLTLGLITVIAYRLTAAR